MNNLVNLPKFKFAFVVAMALNACVLVSLAQDVIMAKENNDFERPALEASEQESDILRGPLYQLGEAELIKYLDAVQSSSDMQYELTSMKISRDKNFQLIVRAIVNWRMDGQQFTWVHLYWVDSEGTEGGLSAPKV